MSTYNQWSTSPLRRRFKSISEPNSIIANITNVDGSDELMRNVSAAVNRTWIYSPDGVTVVDSNQCEHVVDRLWLLGCGNVNCTGHYVSGSYDYFYLKDADFDTSCFSGVFSPRDNYAVANPSRIKNSVNADGSTGGSAYWWWLRSAYSDSGIHVGCVDYYGGVSSSWANFSNGCSPALVIG